MAEQLPERPTTAGTATAVIDSALFREVLGHFLTGVAVVTACDRGIPVGMTCQSLASLSIDPPLVLFCAAKTSSTWPRIASAEHFCLNILAEDQHDICAGFARPGTDKFDGVGYSVKAHGAPVLDDVLAHIECTIDAVHDGGDHHIVVGRVVDLGVGRSSAPLPYFRGGFRL